MIHLVMKDFYVNRKYLLLISMLVCFILILSGPSSSVAIFAGGFASYSMLIRSCFYDDKDKGDIFLRTLPIKKSVIVLSKYIFLLSMLIIVAVVSLLFSILINEDFRAYYMSFMFFVPIICFINAIYLPAFFKYGYEKATTYQTLLFLVMIFLPFGFEKIGSLMQMQDFNFLSSIISLITSSSIYTTFLVVCALSLALLAISYKFSLKLYLAR
ncbi:MAG TPA: ABC-2 transporter permease [Tepidanaerobacter syntrophicus]|uniref:ABC-2 transporter permease n=1 Tax=Tepidanaerobacter syntrophicus TaxID=224999 RepID=UPI001778B512|nr:ABC-2 transporter permease [Tepidanaerobacter syntrophicus]HHV83988.1 ABC-2 transporter permease [Tepidanaerobacter syntrophicus]